MTKKHLQFCIYYMQTGDQQVAYKMTYPRAAVKSLKASASRLMARPDVAEWVNGTEERVHNRMMRQFHNEHYDEFKEKLLTINEKRTVLTKIIKGETKRVRYIKGKYGPQKVEEDLPVYAVLRAVDLDTRLENFYNYLTRSDTWRKAQNIYVNTPTLQQQVNILISQTTDNEETKDVQTEIESPRPGDLGVNAQSLSPAACPDGFGSGGVTPVTGVEHSRRTIAEEIPPCKEVASRMCGNEDVLASDTHEKQNTSPRPGDLGVHSRSTHHTKKTPHFITTEPVSSLRQKKNINRLTKVNNSAKRSHCHQSKEHQQDNNLAKRSHCHQSERHEEDNNVTKVNKSNASVPPPARTSPPLPPMAGQAAAGDR